MAGEENTPQGSGEGNFGQNLAGALRSAGNAAVERATQANQTPTEPDTNVAPASPEPAPPPTQTTEPAAPTAEQRVKYMRKGKAFDLGTEDVQALIDGYMDTLEAAQAQAANQAQATEPAPDQAQQQGATNATPEQLPSMSDILKEVKELKKAQTDLVKAEKQRQKDDAQRRQEEETKAIMKSVDDFFDKGHPTLKKVFKSGNKKITELHERASKAFTMVSKGLDPNADLAKAAKVFTDILEVAMEEGAKGYLQTKIGHSANRTEGTGGGVPVTAPKKMTNREFLGGKAMESAYQRAAAASMAS